MPEFHLSPTRANGVSCNVDGAFVGAIPLLDRRQKNNKDQWHLRECKELSEQISGLYGLPIDMSSKTGGLKAIANALNRGNVARAQIATVLLGIPDPPRLSKRVRSRDEAVALIRDLHWSGMIKWDPDEHPRWPAGNEDHKGGKFAPKGQRGRTGASPTAQARAADQENSRTHEPVDSEHENIWETLIYRTKPNPHSPKSGRPKSPKALTISPRPLTRGMRSCTR